jgi:hypothetical protein
VQPVTGYLQCTFIQGIKWLLLRVDKASSIKEDLLLLLLDIAILVAANIC